jgi:hypothetical protein
MDNLENPPAAASSASPESDLQAQIVSLRNTVNILLVLIIIVGGAFMLFVRRQADMTKVELNNLRPQKPQIDMQYQKLAGPDLETFLRRLSEYGATHPDFAPIVTKYGLAKPTGPTSAAPARATSPATAPVPVKK